MITPQNLEFAAKYGPAGVIALVLGYWIWKLVWHIIKETVPKDMYDEQRKSEVADLTSAVEANTSTLEKMRMLFEERIPRKGA